MRNKKIIGLVLLLIIGATVAFCLLPASRLQVAGNLSPHDLAEIKRVIAHEIWRGTFPDHSWASIKKLPGNIYARAATHIRSIEAQPNGIVRTTISTGKSRPSELLRPAYYELNLRKGVNGWEIRSMMGDMDQRILF